jgi:hypothetical protein
MRDKDRMHTFLYSPPILLPRRSTQCSTATTEQIYTTETDPTRAQIHTRKDLCFANCANIYHHPLLTSVGLANLLPKFTVTRLCNATVLISKGKGCAELSPTAVGAGALAATWL